MDKQKGLAPILIVLLITAAVGGYLIYSGKINVSQIKPTPTYRPPDATTMSKSQNDETANWKTYTNTQFGFSFQYPSTTKITINRPFSTNPSDVNLGELIMEMESTTPYDTLKVQPAWVGIGIWRDLGVTIKDSVSRDSWCDKLQPSLIGQEECKSKANLPEVTFNGYKAFLFHELISSHVERNTYYIPYNHYVFVIVTSKKTILSPNGQGWIIVEDPNLSKILSTFKFTQ